MQNAKGSAGPLTTPLAPVFNITVGDGLVNLLRPACHANPDHTSVRKSGSVRFFAPKMGNRRPQPV